MSLLQAYRNLTPRTRLAVGAGLLVWGVVGLQLSDRAEEKYGLAATERDREELARMMPVRISAADREGATNPGAGAEGK